MADNKNKVTDVSTVAENPANNKENTAKANKESKGKAVKKGNEKPGFFKRIANWFKGLKSEFKKITWANRKSTFKNFGIVLTIVILSALVIGLVDIGLKELFDLLYKNINLG